MKSIWTILLVCTLLSCRSGMEKKETVHHKKVTEKPVRHKVMEFIEYKDDVDGDDLVITKKGDRLFSFINDQSNDRSLLRGDLIDLAWKTVTIENAGDSGTEQEAEKIVSIAKVKNGNVSNFRKHYQKPLKYNWIKEENHSGHFLEKLYRLVEYYVASSDNKLIKHHVKNRDQLSYSIEHQTRDSKEYVMIGISVTSEGHVNTIQWLYVDKAENSLYEYDLPNDRLVRFE